MCVSVCLFVCACVYACTMLFVCQTDSGVVQHQQQRPPSLDLVMTHFPLVSQLCRPDHWATLGRLVLDRIQPQSAVLARATKTLVYTARLILF